MAITKRSNKKVTYTDYASWTDDQRWEIVDGFAYNMGPAPRISHQRVSGRLFSALEQSLTEQTCVPFHAPTDVVLSDADVVQPDILVVCDPEKVTETNIQGAPDLVIEILSESSAKMDRWTKKNLYRDAGVREYLIVDPDAEFIEQYVLQDGEFKQLGLFDKKQTITLASIPKIILKLSTVFE